MTPKYACFYEIEGIMIETVLRKAKRVQQDTETQERIFRENSYPLRACQ